MVVHTASHLQHPQMLCLGAWNSCQIDPRIKTDKTAAMAHRQPQQIRISNLPVAEQLRPMQAAGIQQAVVIGNEQMCRCGRRLPQALCYRR